MRYLYLILIMAALCSCRRNACTTATFDAIYLQPDTAYSDTSATLSCYTKGRAFSSPIATYDNSVDTSQYSYYKKVVFPQNTNVYDCDWRLVMHPSGATFDITNITHSSTYEQRGLIWDGEDKGCTNTVYYTVNGSTKTETPEVNSNNASQATAVIWVQYP